MTEIMVIDDDALILESTMLALETQGYSVVTVFSGAEGLTQLEKSCPDLILLDVMMPGMDGWETLRRIKEFEGCRDIPVVIFTVKEMGGEELEKRKKLGVTAHISKPFKLEHLFSQIEEALEKRG
ncbi:response regulator MprA [archaeon BMS3Abin16]|nr:response regulator MprA [archaeon BMS3Abin16]